MGEYQPISEAPRTGEPVLANGPLGPHVVYWGRRDRGEVLVGCPDASDGRWIAATDSSRDYLPDPTHFLPIPPLWPCNCLGGGAVDGGSANKLQVVQEEGPSTAHPLSIVHASLVRFWVPVR